MRVIRGAFPFGDVTSLKSKEAGRFRAFPALHNEAVAEPNAALSLGTANSRGCTGTVLPVTGRASSWGVPGTPSGLAHLWVPLIWAQGGAQPHGADLWRMRRGRSWPSPGSVCLSGWGGRGNEQLQGSQGVLISTCRARTHCRTQRQPQTGFSSSKRGLRGGRGGLVAPAAVSAASCSKGSPGPKIARYHYLHLIEGVLNATSTTHKPNGK